MYGATAATPSLSDCWRSAPPRSNHVGRHGMTKMWSPTPSKCGALQPLRRIRRSEVLANTPLRGLGELALAMLASYVLTRRFGECWRRWGGVAGAFGCGWRVATRLALVVAVSGRGEASGVGPLALCVWVGAARAVPGGSLVLAACRRRRVVRVVGLDRPVWLGCRVGS